MVGDQAMFGLLISWVSPGPNGRAARRHRVGWRDWAARRSKVGPAAPHRGSGHRKGGAQIAEGWGRDLSQTARLNRAERLPAGAS